MWLAIANFSAIAGEAGQKFFATLTTADLSRGPADPTPQQIEAARTAKESLPAADDPSGHWGDVIEGFQLSIRFDKDTFRAGEPVTVTVLIRNVTEKKVFYRDFVGMRGDSPVCQFDVLDERQKPVARVDPRAPADITDGPHIPRGLKPGTQCRYDMKLEGKFKLDQSGRYTIRARRWVHKLQGDGYAQLESGLA